VATGLLLFSTAVFVACVSVGEDAGSWVGYVRATAEASMVGALADWFAVTALFRHPLGLPIPHTAIIPRKKDQIGRSLGAFVRDHFLTREVVDTRFDDLDVPGRLASFLSAPGRAERLARDVAVTLKGGTEMTDDDFVRDGFERAVKAKLSSLRAAPLLAELLESLVYDKCRRRLLSALFRQAADRLLENRDRFRDFLAQKSPWYVPRILDSKLFGAAFELQALLARLADEQSSDRDNLDKEILGLVKRLRTDPVLIERVERTKSDLADNEYIRKLAGSL